MLCQATWLDVPICWYYCRLAGLFPLRFASQALSIPQKAPRNAKQTDHSWLLGHSFHLSGNFPWYSAFKFWSRQWIAILARKTERDGSHC